MGQIARHAPTAPVTAHISGPLAAIRHSQPLCKK